MYVNVNKGPSLHDELRADGHPYNGPWANIQRLIIIGELQEPLDATGGVLRTLTHVALDLTCQHGALEMS